ncbi:MAG: hypothetical protein ACTSYA_05920 [Candidatus Kariarchaeaceae archaeon]
MITHNIRPQPWKQWSTYSLISLAIGIAILMIASLTSETGEPSPALTFPILILLAGPVLLLAIYNYRIFQDMENYYRHVLKITDIYTVGRYSHLTRIYVNNKKIELYKPWSAFIFTLLWLIPVPFIITNKFSQLKDMHELSNKPYDGPSGAKALFMIIGGSCLFYVPGIIAIYYLDKIWNDKFNALISNEVVFNEVVSNNETIQE